MPLTNEIKALSDKVYWLSDHLARHWLLQAAIDFVGVLYLIDSPLAALVAEDLKINSELIRITVPVLSVCNFARMGYLLGGYILTRAELARLRSAQPDSLSLEIATESYSLFRYVDYLVTGADTVGSTSLNFPYRVLPIFLVVTVSLGVFTFGNALAVYFVASLTEHWSLCIVVVVVFASLYVQFIFTMRNRLKRSWPAILNFAIFLIMATLLVHADFMETLSLKR